MDNIKNKVLSGVVWKFAERILSQGVTFVVSLVIARILLPEDYGMIAMISVFINIAIVLVSNGFNSALIQGQSVTEEDFSTLFWSSLFISISIYIILFLLAPLISKFYNVTELTPIIRVFSILLPISAYNSIQNAYVAKKMDFKKNFIASLIASIVSGIIGIILAKKGFGVWALVFQTLSSIFLNTIVQAFIVKWHPKFVFSLKKSTPLLKFGANSLGADLIGTIFNQLNSFAMGKWYSAADLAYYNKGYSFPQLIHGNVCGIIASVMYPAFSSEIKDLNRLKDMARKTTKMINFVLCPIYIGMIAVSYNMIKLLLTEKWIQSVPFLIIVCVTYIIYNISPLDLLLLRSIGRSDIVFRLEFIKKPIWLTMLIISVFINVYAVAIVLIFAVLLEAIINSIAIKKFLNYGFFLKLKDWIKVIYPSLLMFIIVVAMNLFNINILILFPLQIIVGIVFYILFSIITKNECFFYLVNMIKNRKQNKLI